MSRETRLAANTFNVDLRGLFAPLPTPFTDDGSTVSEIRLSKIIRFLRGRVNGYVICSETGEFSVCSISERKQLAEIALRDSQGVPVLVNVSTIGTNAALDLAQHAKRHGARAAVCSPPIYGNYCDAEIVSFFQKMAQYAGLPILVVDPAKRVTEDIREQLTNLQPLVWTKALVSGLCTDATHTDEFSAFDMTASPLVTMQPNILAEPPNLRTQEPTISEFARLFRRSGSQRLVKAALEIYDLECGPMRGPCRWLPHALEAELKDLLEASKPANSSAA